MVRCIARAPITTRIKGERITFKKGDSFECWEEEAKRLVKLKVAEVEGQIEEKETIYLTEQELSKLTKEELKEYGQSLEIEVDTTLKKDDMIATILDTLQERKANGEA
jgi:hypothetical protein